MNIFNQFCKHVDSLIFSKENMGSAVMFIIDQSFIYEFCNRYSISERQLMQAVRSNLYGYSKDILRIKGILAIQMYAASKRANSDGVTVKNYRKRLSDLLDWHVDDLQQWMEDHQDSYWKSFYDWCDSHYFEISKCYPYSGTYRYVQYPVNLSQCVFTEEDLLYIAYCFIEKGLQQNEDLSETDFWRIIGRLRVANYCQTTHSKELVTTCKDTEIWQKQIFNFYLRWKGDYKLPYSYQKKKIEEIDKFLYLKGDFSSLEIRNTKLVLKESLPISKLSFQSASKIYSFKRDGLIIFKRDDIYEDYWQETRYLDKGHTGLAIVFSEKQYKYSGIRWGKVLLQSSSYKMYEFEETLSTSEFFTESRFYNLEGGLKIGRNTYLLGAAPVLVLSRSEQFLIDGELPMLNPVDGRLSLNYLKEGVHCIKFKNYKKLEFELVAANASSPDWINDNHSWMINNLDVLWESGRFDNGIVGMDFSSIPQRDEVSDNKSTLRLWAELHHNPTIEINSNNIAVATLKNILK